MRKPALALAAAFAAAVTLAAQPQQPPSAQAQAQQPDAQRPPVFRTGTARVREALMDFVQTAFGPTDLVALMDQLTPSDGIRLTRDRRSLAEQVHKLQGRLGVYLPPRSAVEEAQLYQMHDVERLRSQVTAS